MIDVERLNIPLHFNKKKITLSKIKCMTDGQTSAQQKTMVQECSKSIYLPVVQDSDGKYVLLDNDEIYLAMVALHKEDKSQFRQVKCLVADNKQLNDIQRDLLIAYHAFELAPKSIAIKLRIAALMHTLVKENESLQEKLTATAAHLLGSSRRYALMLLTVAANGIPELQEAVVSKKKGHLTIQQAAVIANISPEKQKQKLAKFQAGLLRQKPAAMEKRQQAVAQWLEDLQKAMEAGKTLSEADQALLAQVQQLTGGR